MTMPMASEVHSSRSGERLLARLLRPFAQVEPSEAVSAALLTLTVFLLLLGYYLLKTAREPLILLHGGAEVKSYAAAGQSVLLLMIIPAYAALARRVGRVRLLLFVYGFFVSNLLLFALLLSGGAEIGVPFYLWVGVFNVTAIAQLWSFANDLYAPEQGQRLFAILGIGSSVGAVLGAYIAKSLADLGPGAMLLAAAGILGVCIVIVTSVDRRERRGRAPAPLMPVAEEPLIQGSALQALLHDKYLLWIAALTFLLNFVNTNGEYLLDRALLEVISGQGVNRLEATRQVGVFKADYFFWVNWLGVLLQLFVVSRVLRILGPRKVLFVLPVVAFFSYAAMLLTPVLALIRVAKIAENSLDYSVQNTARQALFLVGSRAEKYLGKTVIDTVIVRSGDVFSAALVYGVKKLQLPVAVFAILNLSFIALWLVVVFGLGREHARRSAELAHAGQAG